ncbi:MAG: nuclear transport factor 2 family protein [Candidatus Binatia bacterium]|nr:nuclear transport factor 2 family protein [Candidatus Binatia bacterium]
MSRRRVFACPLAAVGLFTLLQVAGCNGWPQPVPSDLDARRWAVAWIGALNSRTVEQLDGLLPPDARYWSSAFGTWIGAEKLPRHVQGYWRLFPNGQVQQRAVHRGPGSIVIEWWAWPDRLDDKKRWRGVSIFFLRQGRVRDVVTFFDPTVLLPYVYRDEPEKR